MANPIGWVEIPVLNIERATKFYGDIMGWTIPVSPMGDLKMGWLPFDQEDNIGSSGALVQNENYKPSLTDGPVVYLSCQDVQSVLDKVTAAGGTIINGKKQISPDHGFMAIISDTEGNRIAFHSYQ